MVFYDSIARLQPLPSTLEKKVGDANLERVFLGLCRECHGAHRARRVAALLVVAGRAAAGRF